jgi:hypothetical protein
MTEKMQSIADIGKISEQEQKQEEATVVNFLLHHLNTSLHERVRHETTVNAAEILLKLSADVARSVRSLVDSGAIGQNGQDAAARMERELERRRKRRDRERTGRDNKEGEQDSKEKPEPESAAQDSPAKRRPTLSFLLHDADELALKSELLSLLFKVLQSLEAELLYTTRKRSLQNAQNSEKENDSEKRLEKDK